MSVISIETRKANELAAITNISDTSIFMVHDGTGLKRITFEDVKRAMVYPNAGSHNSIYRGKNLGSTVTQAQYTAIRNGTFEDLFIGDYWVMNGNNYRIAAFDYYYNTGDSPCTAHHVVIVPDKSLYNASMNTSNTSNGGYVGSNMYRTNLANAKSTVRGLFSGHILSHRIYLSNTIANGRISNGVWLDTEIDLLSEYMVYGNSIFTPMSNGVDVPTNYRVDKSQLPLFKHDHSIISLGRETWWLRDVASQYGYCAVSADGVAYTDNATSQFGVRPFFCVS